MPQKITFDLGRTHIPFQVPDSAEILSMGTAVPLAHSKQALLNALRNPYGTQSLQDLIRHKLQYNLKTKAVIVISDNTRPVPYKGEQGILYPIINEMVMAGLPPSRIQILIATGTHHPLGDNELKQILPPEIFSFGIDIINHDCRNSQDLMSIGRTKIGGEILINRHYMSADIKILTGLVESHFMAGASGGRKSICPGLMAEKSIHILHGGKILNSPNARDLVLDNNPVHEEALKVAGMAGCDMIVNVTLDQEYNLTGVFAGKLDTAHQEAVNKLHEYASIPVKNKYDIIVTHSGYVGINHYQAAKAAAVSATIIKPGGYCILASQHADIDPVGSPDYRRMLRLLKEKGTEGFLDMILSDKWTFVPEQWEPQMWTRLFKVIPEENLLYCTYEIPPDDFKWIPGTDARTLAPQARSLSQLIERSIEHAINTFQKKTGMPPNIAVLGDGPYGIPVTAGSSH